MDTNETGQVATPRPTAGPARVSVPPPGYVPVGSAPPVAPAAAAKTARRERERVPGGVRLLGGCLVLFALVSILCGLLGGFSALLFGNARTATATETGVIPVTGGVAPTLAISAEAGSVFVVPSPDGEIHYTLEKRAHGITQQQADQALADLGVSATQTGDTVTIGTHGNGLNPVNWWLERRITLTVETPAQTSVRVALTTGTLELRDLTLAGDSTISGTAGTVTLTRVVVARSLTVRMTSGTIDFQGSLGASATLDARVTAGSVSVGLPVNTRAHLEARATAGNVDVDPSSWPTIQTRRNGSHVSATGDLGPSSSTAGTVTLEATSGTVRVYAQ